MADLDRRIRRTRRMLHGALIELILEKGYGHITVQDILDRADVGRSTFYSHFRDKDALLMASFDDLRDELRREFDAMRPDMPASGAEPAIAVIFGHAHRNRRVYQALCGKRGGEFVHDHLHRLISAILRDHLEPHLATADSDLPVDVVAEFCTSAALGLLTWWVAHDFPYGPTRLAEMYRRLAAPGIRAALGRAPE